MTKNLIQYINLKLDSLNQDYQDKLNQLEKELK